MTGARILVDLDGVVVDLMGEAAARGYFDLWPCQFNFAGCCTKMSMDDVLSGDIFATAKPIQGAVRAVEALSLFGCDVRFVSTPWPSNHASAMHKYQWVERHFGDPRLLTLTYDKTLIPAVLLVDDKPNLVGPWHHVTYPQAWNDSHYPTWEDGLAEAIILAAAP